MLLDKLKIEQSKIFDFVKQKKIEQNKMKSYFINFYFSPKGLK